MNSCQINAHCDDFVGGRVTWTRAFPLFIGTDALATDIYKQHVVFIKGQD